MQRLWAVLCAIFVLTVVPVQVLAQATVFRNTVYVGDVNRDFNIIWSRGDPSNSRSLGLVVAGDTGDLDNVILRSVLGDKIAGKCFIRESTQFESWHWKAFQVPANLPIGTYDVLVAGRVKSSVKVAVAPPTKIIKLTPGERTNGLTVRTGEHVRGYGTVMTGNLTVQAGATITGLTIDGSVTGVFDNVVFDSCTFRRGMIGPMLETDREAFFKDCRFESYTVATCSSGCFLRCLFTGRPALGVHNFCNERGTRLALINCTFDNTDRGIIARPRWGDNSDNLYAGIWFKHIAQTNNGDELFCVEGDDNPGWGFNRNLIFGVRSIGCHSGVVLFNAYASGNLFNNIRIPVDITGIRPQKGNVIHDSECEYIHINWPVKQPDGSTKWLTDATDTKLLNVYSVGFLPRARNQATGDPQWWADTKFQAVFQDGSPTPTTKGSGLAVKGQAEGISAVKGIAP